MDPSLTLLNAKISPFRFRHQMGFRDQLGDVLGQHDMPVRETWKDGENSHQYRVQYEELAYKAEEKKEKNRFLMVGSLYNLIVG